MSETDHHVLRCNWQNLILVVLLLFYFQTVKPQNAVNRYSDSILNIARKAPTKEAKIEGLLNVSIFWIDYDTMRAYQYLNEARTEMGKSPNDYYKGLYHLYLGNILMDFEPAKAKAEFSIADSFLTKDTSAKSFLYRSKLWNNYGVVLQKEDNAAAFMEIIVNKTIPYARKAGDSAQVGYQLQNMAMLMSNLTNYQKAADFYAQALITLREIPGIEQKRLDIFINAAKNALQMKNQLQSRRYLDSASKYIYKLPYSTSVPAYYRTELIYFKNARNNKKVLENYQMGILAAKNLRDNYALKELNFELSTFYRDLGEYQKAKGYLLKSYQNQPYSRLQNRAMFQQEMAKIEYHLGNYKTAYDFMDSLRMTMDAIYQKDVATKVLNYEQQYETAEKENQILRLESKSKQQELAIARSRWWQMALGAGLVWAVCIAFFSWAISKKNKKLLTQKEQLHREEMHSLQQKERLGKYDAMLQGQEAERSRLAKDLHDGLGGLLAGIKLKLSSIIAKAERKGVAKSEPIHEVMNQLDYSVDELRKIAHNMMPESLRYGGLASALSDLCRYMNTPMVTVAFQNLGIRDNYSDHLRTTVYRVVQELLTNAVKHAHAKKIILQCSELENWLFLTVEDNGKGMAQSKNSTQKGLGLNNIQTRISLLNGHIETLSVPGEGTTINIQIPL